jgi:hypothetical protein
MNLEKKALHIFNTFKDKDKSLKAVDVIVEELETYNKRGLNIWFNERIKDWKKVKLILENKN